MKKQNKSILIIQNRIVFFLAILTASFCLAGCGTGSVVDTSMVINSDMSGSRIIDIHVEDDVFKSSNVSGNLDQIKEIIAKYMPDSMTCEYTESTSIGNKDKGTKVTFSFKIDFSSKDDYISKIKSLIGDDVAVEVEIPDNIWSSGIYFSESFSSRDLMKWLQDAIVAEGLVSQSNAGYILGKGTNIVFFANESFEVDEHINVNTITKLQINDINLLLDVNDINLMDVTVIFKIPEATMNKRGSDIRAYMDALASNDIELTEDGANDVIFSLKSSNRNISGVSDTLKKIFGSNNAEMTTLSYDENLFSPLQFVNYLNLKVSYSEYVGSDNTNTHTKVSIKSTDYISVAHTDDLSQIEYLSADDGYYDGYLLVGEGCQNFWDINLLTCKDIQLKKIDVSVKCNRNNTKCQNDTAFYFENVPSDIEKVMLTDRFNIILSGALSDVKNKNEISVTVDDSDISNEYLLISANGNIDSILKVNRALYGNNASIYFAHDNSYDLYTKFSFVHKNDFSKYVINPSEQFGINYTLELNGKICDINVQNLTPLYDDNKMTVFVPGANLDIEATGKYFNFLSLIISILIFTGGIIIIYSIFFTNLLFGRNNEVYPDVENRDDKNIDVNANKSAEPEFSNDIQEDESEELISDKKSEDVENDKKTIGNDIEIIKDDIDKNIDAADSRKEELLFDEKNKETL